MLNIIRSTDYSLHLAVCMSVCEFTVRVGLLRLRLIHIAHGIWIFLMDLEG